MFSSLSSAFARCGCRNDVPHHRRECGYLYAAEDFRQILRRECARRYSATHGFSLVTVEVPPEAGLVSLDSRLLNMIGDRLRITDLAGWLETGVRLAILLYACPEADALGYVERLRHSCRECDFTCRIYRYPGELPQNILADTEPPSEPAAPLPQPAKPAEFREELQRVQARVERTGGFFSLLTFEMPSGGRPEDAEALAEILLKHVRVCDFYGCFDDSLGVILDGLLVCSALTFADRVCREAAGKLDTPLRCVIRNFPAEPTDVDIRDYCAGCSQSRSECGADGHLYSAAFCNLNSTTMPSAITVEYGNSAATSRRVPAGAGLPPWKRGIDIAVSVLVLLLLSPVLALVALLIAMSSPGGVIYRQKRIGYLGRPFMLYKFRSMRADKANPEHKAFMKHVITENEEEPMLKEKGNPDLRTTWIGKIIRITSLDEVPQLVNVLKGEMSLVGPRPPIPYEAEVYKRWHGGRFDSVPGLTGLWQVSGKNRLSFREMARLDIQYSRNLSLHNDLMIIAKTPLVILRECLDAMHGRQKPGEIS